MVSDRPEQPDMTLTVVVPVFNGLPFVLDAIESVLRASWIGSREVIVVDDASSDDSVRTISASHPGVRVIALRSNVGEAVARNVGLAHATGRYVTFLDQDDLVFDDHFMALYAALERHDADAAAPRCMSIGPSDDLTRLSGVGALGRPPAEADRIVSADDARAGGISNTLFARRETLIACGGFTPLLRGVGDYILAWNAARTHRLVKIGHVTYAYRQHAGMSSYRYDMARNGLLVHAALMLAAPGSRPSSAETGWTVDLTSVVASAGKHRRRSAADALALGWLSGLRGRSWLAVLRRVVRPHR
jgi:glycosyltransferase involved in cell wall biosynthesis